MFSSHFLWEGVDVSVVTSTDWIRYSLGVASGGVLDLRMDLYRGATNSVATILALFFDAFPRTRTLWITVEDNTILNLVATHLCNATFDALEVLNLLGGAQQGEQLIMPQIEIPAWLGHIRSLRLRRIWFDWSGAITFRSLQTLVLRDIHRQYAPDWSVWNAIATAAPDMRRISLRNIGCANTPVHPPTLLFRNLTNLDLMFGADTEALYALLCAFHAPQLNFLMFTGPSTRLLLCLLKHSDMLQHLHELVVRISHVDVAEMHRFLRHTPNVRLLKVLKRDSRVLEAMSIADTSVPNASPLTSFVCPLLETLGVKYADPSDIRDFMVARDRLLDLKQIFFHRQLPTESSDEEEELHIFWIECRVAVGANLPVSDPYWLRADAEWIDQ